MTIKTSLHCDTCGRSIKSTRIQSGSYHCEPCRRRLPRSGCQTCGKTMVHRAEENPVCCKACTQIKARIDTPCDRCGDVITRQGAIHAGKAYCRKCKRYARAEKQCHYCGRWHTQVYASKTAELDKPACPICIRQRTPTCGVCRRKTRLVGRVDGVPACEVCVNRGTLLTGLCNNCGQVTDTPNTNRCMGCVNLRLAQAVARHAENSLNQEWAKQLFRRFVENASREEKRNSTIDLIRRNIDGFRLLDKAFMSEATLTVSEVLKAFSDDRSGRRFRVLKNWLSVTHTLNFDGQEAQWFRHRAYVQRRLDMETTDWVRAVLATFLDDIYARRNKSVKAGTVRINGPLALRSIELALKYAQWLLRFCQERGISMAEGIDQASIDTYAMRRPKVYQSLGAFIRFINRTSHSLNRISLPSKPRSRSSLFNKLNLASRSALINRWLSATETRDLRNASIALLCYFYVQRARTIVQLKRGAIRTGAQGGMEIDFGQGFIEIHSDIAATLNRWLLVWGAPSRFVTQSNDDHVFPGIQPERPYSIKAFQLWLKKKHGVGGRQLFATALHGVIDAGLNDPGALVSLFGITPSTAIRYWTESGRDLSSYLFNESIKKLREEGYLVKSNS